MSSETETGNTSLLQPNTLIAGTVAAIVVYLIWLGVTGTPVPEWLLWVTTIL